MKLSDFKKISNPKVLFESLRHFYVIPKPSSPQKVESRSDSKDTDDILSLIEAEKPPDYVDHVQDEPQDSYNVNKVKLPSTKPRSRESSEPKQTNSILQLACNYDDSDNEDETDQESQPVQNKVTKIDSSGRLVFNPNDDCDWQTDEQRASLEKYKIENMKTEKLRQRQDVQQEVTR